MTAFKGLLKKDFHISKVGYFSYLILLTIIIIASFILTIKFDEPMVLIGFLIMLMVMHIGLIPLTVLSMLRIEGKTQIWLYNPQNSRVLVLSKLIVSGLYQIISQVILFILSLFIFNIYFSQNEHISNFPATELIYVHLFLLGLSIYLSCWIIFYWSIYHSLGKITWLKKSRWVVIVLLIFAFNFIKALVLKIKPLNHFINDWNVSIRLNQSFHYTNNQWNTNFNTVEIPVLSLVIYAIIAIILFLISSWLLDRKVEV